MAQETLKWSRHGHLLYSTAIGSELESGVFLDELEKGQKARNRSRLIQTG
jgi:hypothetical protein